MKPLVNCLSHTRRLSFLETSQDETTGAIRFRRRTWAVPRNECRSGSSASTTALQMAGLSHPMPQSEERFVERFEARDIELDVESKSMRNGNCCIAEEDDRSRTEDGHTK